MSFGSDSSSTKPIWADAQKDVREDVFRQILLPQLFGGAPDPGFEAGANRGREGLQDQLSSQGLTGSGLAAKASSDFERGVATDREAQRQSILDKVLAPLGQSQKSSGVLHLGK